MLYRCCIVVREEKNFQCLVFYWQFLVREVVIIYGGLSSNEQLLVETCFIVYWSERIDK